MAPTVIACTNGASDGIPLYSSMRPNGRKNSIPSSTTIVLAPDMVFSMTLRAANSPAAPAPA